MLLMNFIYLCVDYKSYAKLAPHGKMSLVLDEEHGGEDTHLVRIAAAFADDLDKTVAPALGLTEGEIKIIKNKYKGKLDLQKYVDHVKVSTLLY